MVGRGPRASADCAVRNAEIGGSVNDPAVRKSGRASACDSVELIVALVFGRGGTRFLHLLGGPLAFFFCAAR